MKSWADYMLYESRFGDMQKKKKYLSKFGFGARSCPDYMLLYIYAAIFISSSTLLNLDLARDHAQIAGGQHSS